MSDPDLKKYLLAQLTKEELKELISETVLESDIQSEPFMDGKFDAMRKFYLSRKIPGSNKVCSSCGQDLVNSNEHANQLLGGENQ